VTAALRQETGLILNLSTGGMGPGIDLGNRKNVLIHESPEMASLNPGTTNFCAAKDDDGSLAYDLTFENPFRATIEYGRLMKVKGIAPEFECFSTGHVHNVLFFQQHYDFLAAPLHFSFVFGILGAVRFDPMSLAAFLHAIPPDATWQGIGVGATCFRVAMACAAFGGHTRVGLEDNIYIDPAARTLAQGSWDQVARVVRIARLVGREPATPAEARAILHLA
jgi:3-keto-5-aminohexanoate cleavage enzyme